MDVAAGSKRINSGYWLLFVLFYAIFANIPFWFANHVLRFFHDGWFCVEYAIVGVLALYLPRIVSAILLFVMITIDMICAVCETYFLTPVECLTNLNSLDKTSGLRTLEIGLVFLFTFCLMLIAAMWPVKKMSQGERRKALAALLLFIVGCISVDAITLIRTKGFIPNPTKPSGGDATKLVSYHEIRLSRRTLVRLLTLAASDRRLDQFERSLNASGAPIQSASSLGLGYEKLAALSDDQEKPNIVLVLLESWGLAADADLRTALVEPYTQPALLAKYEEKTGTVPFYGPTVGGEGRELCGSRIGFKLMTMAAEDLHACLPNQLASKGYHTLSVHGLDGHMFKRSDWYPRAGFEEDVFRDDLEQENLPDCVGAFTGTCDAAIGDWIAHRLDMAKPKPDFVYWVTLNSHLPVPVPSPLQNGASCAAITSLAGKASLCSWYQLVENVHRSVVKLALSKLARPTVFIIVGDHAPPFGEPDIRRGFSQAVVPYMVLLPRPNEKMTAANH